MTAAEIASALGSARRSGQWWRCVCPVHGSRTGRSLSLSLRDHPRGLAVRCHAGCRRDDVIAELRQRGLLAGYSGGVRPAPVTPRSDRRTHDYAGRREISRRIWGEARDARGTPVERYLASRGITLSVPQSLRWAPRCRHPSGIYLPATIARIDNVDDEVIGIHRTFLQPDGSRKANVEPVKAMLGRAAGGAVRLARAAETLVIGEGIETCLAAMQVTGLPEWAALSTSGMMALLLPPIVGDVLIAVDRDASGAGERAARTAGHRWLAEGRRVRLLIPHVLGADAADLILIEARRAS